MVTLQDQFRQEIARIWGKTEASEGQKEALVQKVNKRGKYEEQISGAIGEIVEQAEDAI